MTPDQALEQLDIWAKVSRQNGQKKRAEKLEGFAEVIRELQEEIRIVDEDDMAMFEGRAALPTIRVGNGPVVPINVAAPSEPGDICAGQPIEPTWREKARSLGIPLYHRKRVDVEADIAAKEVEIRTSSLTKDALGNTVEIKTGIEAERG